MAYPVMLVPPLNAGEVQVRLTERRPPVAASTGASGTRAGIMWTSSEDEPSPRLLTARTM
ncbi:MAG: hypothetical protein A4E31_00381 [Methanomassiliicoccales archaeon PtaU1.Bin030]|nr:MAG: hypothetical protein A4E31_00381 [Methanomassiliicoccales archaeon PtaU1.Bin030]